MEGGVTARAMRLLSWLYTWAILAAFVHFIILPAARSVTVQGYTPQPWAVVGDIYLRRHICVEDDGARKVRSASNGLYRPQTPTTA
jgi:hypothetical protein